MSEFALSEIFCVVLFAVLLAFGLVALLLMWLDKKPHEQEKHVKSSIGSSAYPCYKAGKYRLDAQKDQYL